MRSILVLVLSLFSVAVSAADFNVFWSTDGAADERISGLAQQFQMALKREAGIDAQVTVASAADVSRAVQHNQVDMIVTCNEVDSDRGAPLERLSQKRLDSLTCIGGSNKGAWALASDQDIQRNNSGEFWVYFMRDSEHFTQFRKVREAMQAITQQLQIESIMSAAAQ